MEWKAWVGKIVFIKLEDGQIFSYSEVLEYEEPFLSILDRDNLPCVFNVKEIVKIKEELYDNREKY